MDTKLSVRRPAGRTHRCCQSTPSVLTARRSRSSPRCAASSNRAGASCSLRAPRARRNSTPARCPISSPETRAIRESDWKIAAAAARPARPPRRDHRADRPQDGDQRAQLRRLDLHGGLRGRQLPDVGQHDRRARPTSATPCAARSRFEQGGKQYRLNDEDRGADPAAARLAPRREARPVDGKPVSGALFDFAPATSSTTRRSCSRAAAGPYYYLPKMESHLEARLWNDVFTFAQKAARRPARHRCAPRC